MLLWFRSNLHILILDLARAYQALKTGTMEKFTRLFLWQWDPKDPWLTYGYNCVTSGDVCAGRALDIAKAKGAELGWEIHPFKADQKEQGVRGRRGHSSQEQGGAGEDEGGARRRRNLRRVHLQDPS